MASKNITLDQVSLDADEDIQSLLSELKGDLSVTNLAEQGDKKGADVMVKMYHAFDGREWEGPLYMVSGEGGAMSLAKYRFTADQVAAAGADPKWIGKQVWYTKPQPVERPQGNILCRFHVNQPDDVKADLAAQGLNAFCRHKTGFLTNAAEDFHTQRRHPRWYKFQQTKSVEDERTNARAQADAIQAQTAALTELVRQLAPTKDK